MQPINVLFGGTSSSSQPFNHLNTIITTATHVIKLLINQL